MGFLDDILESEWAGPAALGLGVAGNIPAWISQAKAAAEEKRIRDILTNPAKFAAFAQGMPSFISSDLINSVAGATRADLAQRGLHDAPGFAAKSIGGAMAPYVAQDVANRFAMAQANLTGAPKTPQFPGFNIGAVLGMLNALRELRGKRAGGTMGTAAGGPLGAPGGATTLPPDFAEALAELMATRQAPIGESEGASEGSLPRFGQGPYYGAAE